MVSAVRSRVPAAPPGDLPATGSVPAALWLRSIRPTLTGPVARLRLAVLCEVETIDPADDERPDDVIVQVERLSDLLDWTRFRDAALATAGVVLRHDDERSPGWAARWRAMVYCSFAAGGAEGGAA